LCTFKADWISFACSPYRGSFPMLNSTITMLHVYNIRNIIIIIVNCCYSSNKSHGQQRHNFKQKTKKHTRMWWETYSILRWYWIIFSDTTEYYNVFVSKKIHTHQCQIINLYFSTMTTTAIRTCIVANEEEYSIIIEAREPSMFHYDSYRNIQI
jgi:hypothetical protein